MRNVRQLIRPKRLLTGIALLSLGLLVGCDEYVRIVRDHDVRIPKGATWAWKPAAEENARARNAAPRSPSTQSDRPVTSRDTIGNENPNQNPRQRAAREPNADDQIVLQKVKVAIEQNLMQKGFKQVSDPATADFVVDYKFAVRRHNETVPVGYGGYPGLVCGPFRCWEGWGPGFVGYENVRFRAGTMVFDFAQQATNHLVYRAIGEKPVNYDEFSLSQDQINGLTHHLLKDLRAGK